MHEQEIIRQLIAQDERGIAALLQHYGPLLRYIISPILPDRLDREECLSETVLHVWKKINQFDRARGSWTAWLTAIARNAALQRARRHQPETAALSEELADQTPTPEEQILARERQQAVLHALERLSVSDRTLFYRKYYYCQPTAQIAAETGMSVRAVEGRLYRLKRKLRQLLGGDEYA